MQISKAQQTPAGSIPALTEALGRYHTGLMTVQLDAVDGAVRRLVATLRLSPAGGKDRIEVDAVPAETTDQIHDAVRELVTEYVRAHDERTFEAVLYFAPGARGKPKDAQRVQWTHDAPSGRRTVDPLTFIHRVAREDHDQLLAVTRVIVDLVKPLGSAFAALAQAQGEVTTRELYVARETAETRGVEIEAKAQVEQQRMMFGALQQFGEIVGLISPGTKAQPPESVPGRWVALLRKLPGETRAVLDELSPGALKIAAMLGDGLQREHAVRIADGLDDLSDEQMARITATLPPELAEELAVLVEET